jgi:type IX secretion system PorP/SprF family membrane protein
MMRLKTISLSVFVIAFLMAGSVHAQQIGQFTQYMFNQLVINPAYAGADEALSVTAIHRGQWSGIDGAPATQTLSGHSLFRNEYAGVGFSIIKDEIGVHRNLIINGSFAYRIKLKEETFLSLGVQMGINNKRSDYASLAGQTYIPNDPKLSSSDVSQTFLDFGTGIYFRSPRLELGLSAPKLFSGNTEFNDSISINLNKTHYFLFSRYSLPINTSLDLQPGFLIKYLPGLPVSMDLNLNLLINQVLLFGVSYRSYESINLMAQARLTPQLRFGYAYDFMVGESDLPSITTHEFMLNYLFKFTRTRIAEPR